jgi:G3E family GTPase
LLLELRRLNPSAPIRRIDWSTVAVAQILTSKGFDAADPRSDPRPWLAIDSYRQRDLHDHDHGHPNHWHDHSDPAHFDRLRDKGIESLVLMRDNPLSREELQFLLDGIGQNLGSGLLRVKGLVNIADEPGKPAVIQGAQQLLHTMTWLDHWPDDDQRTCIVFITQGVVRDNLKEVIELLDRMSARTSKARERGRKAYQAAQVERNQD